MCVFQSEQVITLGNVMVSLKKRMATEFARSQTIGLSCVGRSAGTRATKFWRKGEEYYTKNNTIPQL